MEAKSLTTAGLVARLSKCDLDGTICLDMSRLVDVAKMSTRKRGCFDL